jgi:hypothetical protein
MGHGKETICEANVAVVCRWYGFRNLLSGRQIQRRCWLVWDRKGSEGAFMMVPGFVVLAHTSISTYRYGKELWEVLKH